MSDRLFVIFNPCSGKGRGAQLVEPVLAALAHGGPRPDFSLTNAAGDEARLAAEAVERGAETIVAVGGDGTWSNVGNAILKAGRPAKLGLVPGGTGCDLIKSLGIARDVEACARVIREGHVRTIDVGRVEDKYFLNIVGFGYDVAVLEHTWTVRRLRGELLYLYSALRQIYSFPGFPVSMRADDGPDQRQELLMLIIANAQVFGGTFRIAPRARLDDGRLDAVAFGNMSLLQRLGLLGRLLRGTHEGAGPVSCSTASSFGLRFEAPPAYETDGEWNRASTAEITVECVPQALNVLAPRSMA